MRKCFSCSKPPPTLLWNSLLTQMSSVLHFMFSFYLGKGNSSSSFSCLFFPSSPSSSQFPVYNSPTSALLPSAGIIDMHYDTWLLPCPGSAEHEPRTFCRLGKQSTNRVTSWIHSWLLYHIQWWLQLNSVPLKFLFWWDFGLQGFNPHRRKSLAFHLDWQIISCFTL